MPAINLLSIKPLKLPGATQMFANDINDHGQVVGQFSDANGDGHGFVYEEESFCQLDYPDMPGTNLLRINNLGQMVGMFSFTTQNSTAGFFYDRGTFSPPLTYPSTGNFTSVNGLNGRGEMVGIFQDAASITGSFVYKTAQFQALSYPGAQQTWVEAINDSGQVAGRFTDAKGTHGFVYLENVGVFGPPLNYPKSKQMVLHDINNGGQVVGGFMDANGNEHPFLYMAGGLNRIRIPNAVSANVMGINDRGQICGNVVYTNGRVSFTAALPF